MQCQRYDVAVKSDKKKTVNDKLSFLSFFHALRISSLHVAEHMKDEVTTIVDLLYDVVEEE